MDACLRVLGPSASARVHSLTETLLKLAKPVLPDFQVQNLTFFLHGLAQIVELLPTKGEQL
ncbi:unnamed protein product [Amoebophrya sp. A25]|nr:unnamed protein product [Amoebophrya sp. A25]|eukprot:GSA25T00025714001.1